MARGTRRRRRALRIAVALLPLVLILSACAGPEKPKTPPAGSQPVSFTSPDGVRLEGRLFGRDPTLGVVLAHELPEDQRIWWDFAERLGETGYLALTFNFRGYCPGGDAGCSEGERAIAAIWQDVEGAVAFLRSEGAQRVALVGSSMGGTASLIVASRDADIAAVITLSAPATIEGLTVTPDMMSSSQAAKLFVAGEFDGDAAATAQAFYEQSSPPKRVEIFPSEEHGTKLLSGNRSADVTQLVASQLEVYLKGTG